MHSVVLIRSFIGIVMLALLASCKTNERLFKSPTQPIPVNEPLQFSNHVYKTTRASHSSGFTYTPENSHTLLGLLGIPGSYWVDSIALKIDQQGLATITYRDSGSVKTTTLRFRKKSRGFYQYYAVRQIFEIPPVVSFFYGLRKIDRCRLLLTSDGNLVVHEKYVDGQHILILGMERKYKYLFYFGKY